MVRCSVPALTGAVRPRVVDWVFFSDFSSTFALAFSFGFLAVFSDVSEAAPAPGDAFGFRLSR